MPKISGTPFGGVFRGGCWLEAGVNVTLASAIHIVIVVIIRLLEDVLEGIDILVHPRHLVRPRSHYMRGTIPLSAL